MAVEKVGVYRKWLGKIPEDDQGKPIPKSKWPRKRPHRWVVRWYAADQKTRYGKVFKTRREAERYAAELQKRVSLGKADKPTKVTLHEFLSEHQQVMKGQVAYGTLQEHMGALRLFEKFIGGGIRLDKIQPRQAEAFVADRLASGDASVATVNKYIRTLQGIFNLAIEPRGYLAEGQNPFVKIKERKVTENKIRFVDLQEYQLLMDSADLWWHSLLSIAYGSALRRNEILYLTWADIDFEAKRLGVTAKKPTKEIIEWQPKNRQNRIVPISDKTLYLLAKMQAYATEGHPYVFISPQRLERILWRRKQGTWNSRSEPINNIARNFTDIRTAAGVAECTIHDLRRSAITNWARRLPIQVVQTLAGHSSITTTRKYYLAVRPEDYDSANQVQNIIMSGEAAN